MAADVDDPRLAQIVNVLVQLAGGDLSGRLKPSAARDTVDAVMTGFNLLAEELQEIYREMELRVVERTAELVKAQDALRRLALNDQLTGLANRTLFGDRLRQATDLAERGGLPPAVVVLDLDEFKAINDTLGHAAGDDTLIEVARRLILAVRKSDTVARLGGDEFAILIPDATADDALRISQRVLTTLQEPVNLGDHTGWAGASVGLRFGERGQSGDMLLRDADTAMYAAKAMGRGNIQIYQPAMHSAVQDRLQLASDLATAIPAGELTLHYQPVVNLDTRAIVGAEALVRWLHPTRGLIMPSQFISVAEDSGLVAEMGRWVTEAAISQLAEWRDVLPERFQVHVAISSIALRRRGLDEFVADVLHRHHLEPNRLVLEILETGLTTGEVTSMETLVDLRRSGVHIEVADFGIGYSSISYLRGLPLDGVKVNRSLIADIETDERQRRFVGAIFQLIDSVGLRAIVEGVESDEQADQLRHLGYRFAQGPLFGQPMAVAAMTARLCTQGLGASNRAVGHPESGHRQQIVGGPH